MQKIEQSRSVHLKSPQPASPSPSASSRCHRTVGSLISAALALPGVIGGVAHAESAPEQGLIGLKYMYYKDYQRDQDRSQNLDRIQVRSPSIYLLAPIAGEWAVEASAVHDAVSGATPRTHSSVSSASKMYDDRAAGDVRVTRYFSRSSYSVGGAYSNEHDYRSKTISGEAKVSTADNNTTFNVAVAASNDTINPTDIPSIQDKSKRTRQFLLGVTQVVSPQDIAQVTLTYSRGRGYFSDSYKSYDNRPYERDAWIAAANWNHHFVGAGATLRASYRFYTDNWKVNAHTFGAEWVQPVAGGFTVVPSVRYYTQSSAEFYFDSGYNPYTDPSLPPPQYLSADQRLSAFGAYTAGLKFIYNFDQLWTADLKAEYYDQRSEWRYIGTGSPGISPFKAQIYQVGVSRKF